jgi:hypothetical protein
MTTALILAACLLGPAAFAVAWVALLSTLYGKDGPHA